MLRDPSLCKEHYKKVMKLFRLFAAGTILAATASVLPAQAQGQRQTTTATTTRQTTNAATTTNAASSAVISEAKVAIIDTSAFGDAQNGIKRFADSMNRVNGEFQQTETQLKALTERYRALVKQVTDLQGSNMVDQRSLTQKTDEAEAMKRDLERKTQDAQIAYQKRLQEVLAPLQEDIGKALDTFAKARSITIIIDASRVPLLYAVDSIDITREFIADYNRTHPATAAATTNR